MTLPATLPTARPAALARGLAAPATPAVLDAPDAPAAAATGLGPGLDLLARLLDAPSLAIAVHRLATGLAQTGGFSRVTVALVQGGAGQSTGGRPVQGGRLALAGSSQPHAERQTTAHDDKVLGALSEAFEQGQLLAWPPLPTGRGGWAPSLVEQRLLQQLVGGAVASVPLGQHGQNGQHGQAIGAVCVERHQHDAPVLWTAEELQRLAALLALAAPALQWMQAAALPWHRRALQQARQALAHWQRPAAQRRRLLWLLGLLATAAALLWPVADQVGGRARIEGAQQRVLAAPTDGFVHTVHARPGDRVAAGAPLVDLQDADLRLERQRWQSQQVQHENAYASAMGRGDRLTAATSMARFNEAQAQLALVDAQLARGRLVAPFDALVVQGDLSQSIGAPVRQGDALLTLASSGRYRVVVEVDEVDIAAIQPGQRGRLALSAWTGDAVPITVQRITPLAKPVQGHNVFEVEAALDATPAELRPGLLGRAEIHTGQAPLLWAWGRRALLQLRVALWAWLL